MKFKVALRKRYLSLSSIEQVRLKKLKKFILNLMVESELSEGADEKEDINLMLEALVAKYLSITGADDEGLEKCSRVASQLVKLMMMVVIVNLYTITSGGE